MPFIHNSIDNTVAVANAMAEAQYQHMKSSEVGRTNWLKEQRRCYTQHYGRIKPIYCAFNCKIWPFVCVLEQAAKV